MIAIAKSSQRPSNWK